MSERLMIFIDGSNLYHSIKDVCGRTDLDYAKFIQCLAGQRELKRTYFYNALVDQTKDAQGYQQQQRFLAALHNVPYFEIRLGHLVYRPGRPSLSKRGLTYG